MTRTEDELRARERWLATTLRSIGDAVLVVDAEGRVVFLNAEAERLTGWVEAEALGHDAAEILRLFDEETREPVRSPVERAFAGQGAVTLDHPVLLRARDGRVTPIDDSAALLGDGGGSPGGAVVVFRDISDRRRLEARLELSNRLASIGTLTAGMAHEINNPLTFTLGNQEYAIAELEALQGLVAASIGGPAASAIGARLAEVTQALTEARHGADRVRRIITDLKAFSRMDPLGGREVRLESVVDSAIRITANEVRHRARLEREIRGRPVAMGDERQLVQMLANLLLNAAEAIPEGDSDAQSIRVVLATEGTRRAVLEVHDTGAGMTPDVMVRIFDPFFTTRPVGQGTGLGLSISHGIVAAHGGDITVSSHPGQGSIFRVRLPAAALESAPTSVGPDPVSEAPPERPIRRGRVFVIDDEPLVGGLLERVLAADYEVQRTESGREALQILEAGTPFDVVLCDLMMPGLSGPELCARLRAARPEVADRLVFITGGAFTPQVQAFVASLPPDRIVQKPIDLRSLRRLLAERVSA